MWYLLVLPAFSAWIAMLESDSVLIGQWMLSRPMLIGPLVGLVCGELWIGLVLGTLVELFLLESLPVGSVIPVNGTVAAGCAVLLSAGREPVAIAAAFPAGLALGAGHRWLETRLRQRRWALCEEAARALEERGAVDWERAFLKSLGGQMVLTAAFVYASAAALPFAIAFLWDAAPEFFREGFVGAFQAAIWVGLAALMHTLFRTR